MKAPAEAWEMMAREWQIRDVIGRYARGVDRRDAAIIRECFHPGALTHYGDFDGDVDTFVPWVLEYIKIYSATMHFMGNSIIDWPEDGYRNHAIVETYAAVLHEKDGDTPGRSWVGGLRYIDCFESRDSTSGLPAIWRIVERTVVGDWLRIDPTGNHRRFGADIATGEPGLGDPIFALLQRDDG